MSGRGASRTGAVDVPVGAIEADVAVGSAGDARVGATEGMVVASGDVVAVSVTVGAIGVRVLVFVARAVGLGVRKSYDSVPTRCGALVPGVNVGCAVRSSGAGGLTGNTRAASMPKTT